MQVKVSKWLPTLWLDSLWQPSPPLHFRWRTWSLEVWRSTWLVCRVTRMANLQLCMWVFDIEKQKEISAKLIFQSSNRPNCLVFTPGTWVGHSLHRGRLRKQTFQSERQLNSSSWLSLQPLPIFKQFASNYHAYYYLQTTKRVVLRRLSQDADGKLLSCEIHLPTKYVNDHPTKHSTAMNPGTKFVYKQISYHHQHIYNHCSTTHDLTSKGCRHSGSRLQSRMFSIWKWHFNTKQSSVSIVIYLFQMGPYLIFVTDPTDISV